MADSNITRNAMAAAMKALMKEKKLSKISISDICGACGMNRNSFYYHFKDKYDLINWIFYTEFVSNIHLRLSISGKRFLPCGIEDGRTEFFPGIFFRSDGSISEVSCGSDHGCRKRRSFFSAVFRRCFFDGDYPLGNG